MVFVIELKESHFLFIIGLLAIISAIGIATGQSGPNPGHSPSEIGSGTFSGSSGDTWVFPGMVESKSGGFRFPDGTTLSTKFPAPDFDSGWFEMSSQAGTASFKEVAHNLGVYPSMVKVLTKATDGNNNGFIFEAMGSAQADDEDDSYGGVIFAYNQNTVRIWAPDKNNNDANGRIINLGDGWGGEVNTQQSQTAQVRVLAWK